MITLPGDVADEMATAKAPAPATFTPGILYPDPESLAALAAAIDAADKVAIFAGAGVAGAHGAVECWTLNGVPLIGAGPVTATGTPEATSAPGVRRSRSSLAVNIGREWQVGVGGQVGSGILGAGICYIPWT